MTKKTLGTIDCNNKFLQIVSRNFHMSDVSGSLLILLSRSKYIAFQHE